MEQLEAEPTVPTWLCLLTIIVWALLAFSSGAVYSSTARGDGVSLYRCTEDLADLTDPGYISRTTARRLARVECARWERIGGLWWKAIR